DGAAAPTGARTPASRPCGPALEPERGVDADQQRGEEEAAHVCRVDGEAPFRLTVGTVGGEPEEGDARHEVELLAPGAGGGEICRRALEPGVEGEVCPRRADDR